MDRCSSCGAVLTAGATWCGQCFAAAAPPAPPAPASAPTTAWAGPAVPAAGSERLMRTTRWAKTDTTFGPVGRVLATVALLVPFVVMVVGGIADPFVWGGAAVWGLVIMPWGLRDVWKAGQLASA
ncbi:MAG TPA: zinc ribbon domain-containing protein [Mycobacteriales bacterium]|nr:zinc ribbon domain-containing protein [Mycobacteriales bacterium]